MAARGLFRDGFQVLMVQRSPDLDFHGGAWVFPGGKLEPEDGPAAMDGRPLETFRRAAVREVREAFPKFQLMGGVDKIQLMKGRDEIDRELDKFPEIIKSGGCIPHGDHCIPEGVSWDNFKYYRQRLFEIIESTPVLK